MTKFLPMSRNLQNILPRTEWNESQDNFAFATSPSLRELVLFQTGVKTSEDHDYESFKIRPTCNAETMITGLTVYGSAGS